MGSVICASCATQPEIRHRLKSARTEAFALRPRILSAGALGEAAKFSFVKTMVESRLLHNMHLWPELSDSAVRQLDSIRLYCWCHILGLNNAGLNHGNRFTDDQVWAATERPTCIALLVASRVKYLPRLAKVSPPILSALLQASAKFEGSWQQQLVSDLMKVRDAVDSTHPMAAMPPLSSPYALVDFLKCTRNGIHSAVGRFLSCQHRTKCQVAARPAPAFVIVTHHCAECMINFESEAALKSHMHRKHGYLNPLRLRIRGTTCVCCMFNFRSIERHLAHLKIKTISLETK